jgi:hypothetical protein
MSSNRGLDVVCKIHGGSQETECSRRLPGELSVTATSFSERDILF